MSFAIAKFENFEKVTKRLENQSGAGKYFAMMLYIGRNIFRPYAFIHKIWIMKMDRPIFHNQLQGN